MRTRRPASTRPVIQARELLHLGEAKLAALLAEQVGRLPYPAQKRWVREHQAGQSKDRPASGARPAALLKDVEEFCDESRAGAFVSWEDEDGWDPGSDEDDGGQFGEWVAQFTALLRGAMALTRAARHAAAVQAYERLLALLREAGQTTDILGNHGAPEDSVELDLGKVVEAYTRSLLATRGSVEEVITAILPLATRYSYAGGFLGLARALDRKGRERLEARLTGPAEAALTADGRDLPAAVEGLMALAKVTKNHARVLALKERFASRNAEYLRELLAHYGKKRDWRAVARLAELGVQRFGGRAEFAQPLIKAREALGDRSGAVEAQVAHFLERPAPAEFAALKRRAEQLASWSPTFERLLQASALPQGEAGLRTRLLLAEGREREALDRVTRPGRMDFDELKLVAKYAVARLSDGANLARFRKLEELRGRLARDKDEAYDWLRLILRNPGTSGRAEYAQLAAAMYRRLVDLHLDSGKSSRAAPAAHYCAIVFEISRLLNEPDLWADLLRHLTRRHGRKRLIWARLKAEGCPLE